MSTHDSLSKWDRPLEVNKFVMEVPRCGYRWADDGEPVPSTGECLWPEVAGKPPQMIVAGWPEPSRSYEPLVETPDLFVRFRNLDRGRESILEFANKYGWIGREGTVFVRKELYFAPAVGIEKWQSEIDDMVLVDRLAKLAERQDNRELGQLFSWHPERFDVQIHWEVQGREVRKSWRADAAGWLAPGFIMPAQRDRAKKGWQRGDNIRVALGVVERLVNERIGMLCRPILQWEKGKLTGYLTSTNLLGCIWLQYYLSLIGQLKLRRCEICGEEMDVTESRSSRRMHNRCSRNKRQGRYRAKRPKGL